MTKRAAAGAAGGRLLLRWQADASLAERITAATKDAEPWGFWSRETTFLAEAEPDGRATTFYDSRTGAALFRVAPGDFQSFVDESSEHGWPSFRERHVVDGARLVEKDGFEVASSDGTHLGHFSTDPLGKRYCVNLVSVAGWSKDGAEPLRVVGKRGALLREAPALDSRVVATAAKGQVCVGRGDVYVGARRRVFVTFDGDGDARGWLTDAPGIVEPQDVGLVSTCGFVARSDGRPVSAAVLIREFEKSTSLRAPADAAAAWSVQEINLYFMSTGTILPPPRSPGEPQRRPGGRLQLRRGAG